MAILKVARMGHPVLREVAQPVEHDAIATPEFQGFVDDLIETMREYSGLGLAAPQVHVGQRVVAMEIRSNPRYPDVADEPLAILVNPVITPLTEERIEVWEGCLSVPDLRGRVPRVAAIHLEASDRHGRPVSRDFEGFPAAVVQHECDHLDGVLYLDRVEDTTSMSFLAEFQRFQMS